MDIPNIKALLFMKEISERVPGKNLRLFFEKPLLYWILKALSDSIYISEIIINTDSKKIADEAQRYFNVTIHMRPDYLLSINSDEANQIMEYDLSLTAGEYFLQTHSTNPLLKSCTIDKAINSFFHQEEHDTLFSVTPFKTRLYNKDGKPINHNPKKLVKTQELPVIYEENSCIYIFSRSIFKKNRNRIGAKPMIFEIDKFEAVDIDEEFDFYFAEELMKKRNQSYEK